MFLYLGLGLCARYAIIIAGSNGWKEYRHQADAFYMYKILKNNGFDDDHITMWAYNDMVNNPLNPYPGKIFHLLDNKNIYPGEDKIDFKGENVTKHNILNYLRNMNTTKEDNIFFYFNDHGTPNIICLPHDKIITSYELIRTFDQMHKEGKFNKLFFPIEACFSGCFKESLNTPDIAMMTAANCSTSSKGSIKGRLLDVSLSNEFSLHMMMEMESNPKHTIRSLFNNVHAKVEGSTPTLFGDHLDDPISDFIGEAPKSNLRRQAFEDLVPDEKLLHAEKYAKKEYAEEYKKHLRHMKQVAENSEIFIRRVVEKVAGPMAPEFMNKVVTGDLQKCFEPVIDALFSKMTEFNPDYGYLISPIKSLCTKYDSSVIIDAINTV
ncbi:Clan CD, family C13, asparaginyl endopeptidase-like cysteine peptidase [Trichomonas vaginalis G3]|uniref:Clan CD, family C13, asparaginyl endopeptidase-like cysteine peptidase n=1 Tax=Trichomonas vaginalis (strain ATCC PRA-98 / G3) TaxID=412133 RepID=A2DAM6_TRIV3|nr:cysteine-type peptidase protein [Trichomonas vaginalis G3]EAY22529.1 Clan CD, family C13, asparaginyl endopeptidase-like cysteine peptidase [Trichomonas vaginalis G3]KAI5497262.1 cysteine-type peptidase protein [Trichomonas vaginalis G3]|eukprot:XP_001583515.1 Clan CD, family C13, asparaginyl endopeptidase-like cysteine peptidase [Trichomonas vaginalis G3]